MKMENVSETLISQAENISSQCQSNVTDWCTEVHLFHSTLPRGPAVPALICVFAFLTLFSLFTNLFILYTIERSEVLSSLPRFILSKSLIFSNLLQTVTFAPAIINSRRQTMALDIYCYFQHVVGGATIFCRLTTFTCMALERYLFVCKALQYRVKVTRERVCKVIVLIWLCSSAFGVVNLSPVLLREPDTMEQHLGSPCAPAIFRIVSSSLTMLLCLLAHAFSFYSIRRDPSNTVVPFNETNAAAQRSVLFYCGMLFLQLLPLLVKDALGLTGVIELPAGSLEVCLVGPSASAAGFHVFLLAMLQVPPCINPLVFGLWSVELRKALVKLLRWRVGHRENQEQPREMMRFSNIAHLDLSDRQDTNRTRL